MLGMAAMALKQKRYLGALDAASDERFEDHFVESHDLERLLTDQSDIVYGSKGVGKTALRRALTELKRSHYFATKTIDLNNISFEQVNKALSALKIASHEELGSLSKSTWRNILLLYCLEVVSESLEGQDSLRSRISDYLEKEGFIAPSVNDRLLGFLESLMLRIAGAGVLKPKHTDSVMNKQQREIYRGFQTAFTGDGLLKEASVFIKSSGKVVLICLDGLDSIVDHSPEARTAVFSGLITAIYQTSLEPAVSGAFCFKAFLPQELTDYARTLVWDSDKYILNQHFLRWRESDFQQLLRRRLLPYARTKSSIFGEIWDDFMPAKLRNETHGTDEFTFQYILRHTMYRPRQLVTHIQRLLDEWDRISESFKVDPSFIPQQIAATNRMLAESVVNQCEISFAGLGGFLQSMRGAPNIVPAGILLQRIMKMFNCQNDSQVAHSIFDNLYNFGVIGVHKKASVRGATQTGFSFRFVSDQATRSIHTAIEDKQLVAIAPMFHEYCNSSSSEHGVIMPVE
jgi:hypothetical protein